MTYSGTKEWISGRAGVLAVPVGGAAKLPLVIPGYPGTVTGLKAAVQLVRDLVVQSEEAVAEVPVAVPDLAVEEISVSWIITSTGIRW
jgi:hypothetical protein